MNQQLAVVGTGNLGLALVQRLVATGQRPLVHDADQQALDRAAAAGAQLSDLRRIATEADAIWLLLPDASSLAEVLTDDLLHHMAGHGLLLQSSTVGPDTARDLGQRAHAAGVTMVDAPVSGGAGAARNGELLVLLGGPEDALDRAETVLGLAASHIIRTGPVGSASLVKLVNQHVLFAGLAALHEGVRLASAGGVAEQVALAALDVGTARSWLTETWGFYDDLSRDYDEREVPAEHRPWAKDLTEVARAAGQLEVELPSLAATRAGLVDVLRAHAQRRVPASTDQEGTR